MATWHFTTTEQYKQRVVELKGSDKNVYNVGALSIDNLSSLQLHTIEEFNEKFNIDLNIPSILITFHPETVNFKKNLAYVEHLIAALNEIQNYQFIITMPNADTTGNMIRGQLARFISENRNATGVESFGTLGYLSCMKHCSMLLGNTSSGFVEAAYFPKYVVNIGERQRGRILTENIYNCKIEKEEIISAVTNFKHIQLSKKIDLYGDGSAASKIVSELKKLN
jgi:GDP/UDP-N,N'-diacetylbacillosamine 2-epimerase (hydrolysing)